MFPRSQGRLPLCVLPVAAAGLLPIPKVEKPYSETALLIDWSVALKVIF